MKINKLIFLLALLFTFLFILGCSDGSINDAKDSDSSAEIDSLASYKELTRADDAVIFIGNLLAENMYSGEWGDDVKLITSIPTVNSDSEYNG